MLAGSIVLTGSALAMPSPYGTGRPAPAINDSAIYLGPAGALLEADYFHAPQPRYGARRLFPCRPRLHIVAGTRRRAVLRIRNQGPEQPVIAANLSGGSAAGQCNKV
jgi:hypothetical protein